MAHYRKDAASNRDALFGGGGGGGGGGGRNRSAAGGGGGGGGRPSASSSSRATSASASRPSAASSSSSANPFAASSSSSFPSSAASRSHASSSPSGAAPGPSRIFASSGSIARNVPLSTLSGQAKIAKMAEAEDYRLKAKKCMTRGIFSKPDPISAANFYKRAADCYKQCGENRLERLHRIAGGDCQLGQDAYATAAQEYGRAAELAEASDETLARKRQEVHKLNLDAANAWNQMGERGRAAEATMRAAFGLVMGEDPSKSMDPKALAAVEEAIESYVPDPLNRRRDYRRTGTSAYADPVNAESMTSAATLELARRNLVNDSHAHETLFKAGQELIKRRHLESALYAHGAGTAVLESEGFATVSLSRAYLSETVLTLALGDAVAASNDFQRVHLQRTSYLSSRECALAEDLVRACDAMDEEALEEATSRGGPHRAALANLDPEVRALAGEVRACGRAGGKRTKKKKKVEEVAVPRAPAAAARATAPPKKKEVSGEELLQDTDAGFAEMDDIMNQMGLDDDDNEEEEEEDDDEIDLT